MKTSTDIVIVEWFTENSYMSKSHTKTKAKNLIPQELATIGFIVPQNEYYALFFEKEQNGVNLARAEQHIYKKDIKSIVYCDDKI